jgi:hypothetical protein
VPKAVRSAVLMEMFDPPELTAPLEQKLDVVAAHSTTALYNSAEMKRVPLKPLWWPLMKVQQGLGGKARFWTAFTIAALVLLTVAFTVIPYPLKLDATGKLAPEERYYIYSPQEAQIQQFLVNPNDELAPGQPIAVLYNPQFQKEITQLNAEWATANQQVEALSRGGEAGMLNPETRAQRDRDLIKARNDRALKVEMLRNYEKVYNCDLTHPGLFTVTAPVTRPVAGIGSPTWTVLTQDFREQLKNKTITPKDPLMRVGHVSGGWEIVLKIPQKHVGKLMKAFEEAAETEKDGRKYLWVDVLPTSDPHPGSKGRGKLYKDKVTGLAEPNRDDQNESEPVLYAYVRINTPDIPAEDHIDPALLVTDVEVKAKVIGGDHSLGYSLFYGMWEFLYEKVIFFF